jgi:molybdopterin molybdotransferase
MTELVLSRVAHPGVFTHGLAIKPGKPTILGYDEQTDTVLAGLPGHPVSALVVFRVLISWLAHQLFGQKEPFPVPARIACNLDGSPGRTCFQPVALRPSDGGYLAEPVFGKSGMISTLTGADGYIIIDLNKEGLKKDEPVQVFLW